jgi:hypothetical protein
MNAIRIRRKLESDTPHLPELRPLVGKNVEIVVVEYPVASSGDEPLPQVSLLGSVLRYEGPFDPAAPLDEWKANR